MNNTAAQRNIDMPTSINGQSASWPPEIHALFHEKEWVAQDGPKV